MSMRRRERSADSEQWWLKYQQYALFYPEARAVLAAASADPSGRTDATLALQHAVDYARAHYSICYLPPGTYSVSDTITAKQTFRQMATGGVPGVQPHAPGAVGHHGFDFLLDGVSSRYAPNYMRGGKAKAGDSGAKATIVLRAGSAGFDDATKPKQSMLGEFSV